jgi:ATP-dependent Clp protease ATP-binding subunit ClpC
MMREKLQKDLDRVFVATSQLAMNVKDSHLRLSHAVYATMAQSNIISNIIIDELGENVDALMIDLKALYESQSDNDYKPNEPPPFSDVLKRVINNLLMALPKGELLSVEAFFLDIFLTDDPVVDVLVKHNVTKALIEERIKEIRMASNVSNRDEDEEDLAFKPKQKKVSKTPFLDDFGRDLTEMAAKNELDPVFGRDEESERLAQILARRKKNNPVLIGDPGVGKTAIVEKLALSIYNKTCPPPLFGKRLVSLDLAALVAGTKYRGQFEERIKKLIDEVRNNKHIIVFIDEIHMLVGAGNAAGSMDAANIFKPALSRGELQCIGATTINEYRESIEQDGALERRFEKIIVNEPSAADTIQMLHSVKQKYEDHHKVIYSNEAIIEMVRLADRYITNRFFPDKAIDIMDEAGARCRIGLVLPPILTQIEKELAELLVQKEKTVLTDNYERAIVLRDREKELRIQLEAETLKWQKSVDTDKKVITPDMISKVVSVMTKIPVDKISQSERKQLSNIDQILKQIVIGQDDAIESVASSIKRNRLGLAKSNKPIGVFLFIGSTGVGKTYLAKMLAKHIFGSENNLIRFDMSEYSQPFNISRLIGSAPGYVGYEKGGQLTERVRNNPYSVVLFDEIEKAHPDVYNVLLQLFDEGRLTDEMGKTTNFKNTIIIMTSNVGSKELQSYGKGIGYAAHTLDNATAHSIIEKAMKNKFKPEFINRIDEIVQFNILEESYIKSIVQLQLTELITRAKDNNYILTIAPEVNDIIFKEGYNSEYGAREIQRTIQRMIENPISDELLKQDIVDNITIDVKVEDEKITVSLTPPYTT